MVLTVEEESLVRSLRALSPEAVDQVITWTRQIAELAQGRPVQWSDSWTEQTCETRKPLLFATSMSGSKTNIEAG